MVSTLPPIGGPCCRAEPMRRDIPLIGASERDRVTNKKSPMGQCATEQYVNLGYLVLSTAAPFTAVLQILVHIQL